jgi:alkanesulfonate monooxygenase SsuD/methylene tetrahydromethanopterin reductase-like flavin-dependent oxidoreductase (luciferase family)
MSAGRVELGLGAGWFAQEHEAYGIAFPDTAERFDRLEEQLAIIHGMWTTPAGERFSHGGRWWPVVDSPCLPRPVQQPHPPIVIGGHGPRRTPALAARYADEFNAAFPPVDQIVARFDGVRRACETIGRDPASIVYSLALVACCGADEAEVERRARAIGRAPDELRANGVAGTPEECRDRVAAVAELGVQRLYLQILDMSDLEHLELLAATLL